MVLIRSVSLAAVACVLAWSCSKPEASDGQTATGSGSTELNLYTARHYDSDLPLYEQFTRETGIAINRIEGNADQLVARIRAEGPGSPADVFIAADAGALRRAQDAGVFQPVSSTELEARIPSGLREPSGLWFGLTRRARIVAYDPSKVRPDEIDDYADLASPRFAGKLCVRSSDSVYNLSLVGALIEALGTEEARAWTQGVVANMARPPQGGDRDQIRAVGAGECEVALTNSYYYLRMRTGEDQADRAVTEKVALAFPSLAGQGAHVNISGGGVTATAPNRENAIRFLEFLASQNAQAHTASFNSEFPVSEDTPWPEALAPYKSFVAHPMPVHTFAARQSEALALMTEAGWK
jgi:iron(III) transport system substrate-binding protein